MSGTVGYPPECAGTVALVTGAASGIGAALATQLAVAGATVVGTDRDEAALSRFVAGLEAAGHRAVAVPGDVRDAESVQRVADQARTYGPITVACFNAGVCSTGPSLWETPPDVFDFLFDVNTKGLANCVRAVVPGLLSQSEPGYVLITGSMAGLVALGGSAAYAASKAAVVALAKALRQELAASAGHVSVSLLSPGIVKTNLMVTSGATQPAGAMSQSTIDAAHQALNDLGYTAEETATTALRGLFHREFWLLPPSTDMFTEMWRAELKDMLSTSE